ncbi:MAG: Gfo/Idh/MocA family protein [Candidatus Brocadiia bacterium]
MDDATPEKSTKATRRDFLRASAASGAALGTLALHSRVHAAGSDVIKIGMVGCGGRCTGAAMNAMNVDPGVRLVAMCDLFMDRVQRRRQHLKSKKPDQVAVDDAHRFTGFDGYKRVIEAADVVLIANAAKFHPLHMTAALEAGRHVFVEKPHAIDPRGVKQVVAACELAEKKGLSVVSGLQSRFHTGYRETVQRIHDGAIGDVVAIEENFLRAPYGVHRRKPGLNEVQYQCSNQYHFTWLSGDDVPQSLIHNVDRSLWAMRGQPPARCHGLGGRSSMTDEMYGNVFDHHSVVYHFPNGVKLYAFCRTTTGCYNEVSSLVFGTKGRCDLLHCRIDGESKWQWKGRCNPYDEEHRALFQSIRKGEPTNSGYHMAKATLATVMGQVSCYTGKEVSWKQAEASDFFYPPKPEACSFDMDPPVTPGPDGSYPVRVPGKTRLL